MKKITLIIVSLFSIHFSISAQELTQNDYLPDTVDINHQYADIDPDKIELPPVSVFLNAAKTYADVQFFDSKKREAELQLKISRKEWLKYLRLQGNYNYGTTNQLTNESGEINPTETRFSAQTRSWYNAGVTVSIPLDDVFSRKNKNDIARERILQSGYELTRSLEQRQMIILEAYNDVVKNLVLLKINAESVALYDAQMKVSEMDFINGRISIIELSLERGRRTEANIKYQTSRSALHNAVSILEMLTKIKILRQ